MAFWCCSYFCLKSCQIPQIPNNLAYGKIPKFDDQLSARLFREEKKKEIHTNIFRLQTHSKMHRNRKYFVKRNVLHNLSDLFPLFNLKEINVILVNTRGSTPSKTYSGKLKSFRQTSSASAIYSNIIFGGK